METGLQPVAKTAAAITAHLDRSLPESKKGPGATVKPLAEISQREAIARAIAATGYKSTPVTVERVLQKARFYRTTGYVAAAAIQSAWTKVAGKPSDHPRSDAWFTTVVENQLRDRANVNRAEKTTAPHSGRSRH